LQQRGNENPREGIFGEFAEKGQKDIQKKANVGLRSSDAEATQSERRSRVSAEGIQSSITRSQGVSLGGRKVNFSANKGSRAERQRNTQEG